jgi:hypothetical protein
LHRRESRDALQQSISDGPVLVRSPEHRSRPLRPYRRLRFCRRRAALGAADDAGATPGAGRGAYRQQSLRGAAFGRHADTRGLWADPNFAPLPPDNLARLRAERGRFTIIEGKVLSVRESGSTIYVNFGARRSQGFSVIILRRNQRIFNAAGVEPKRLEGRRIRVRGVLEARRGPVIEADAPEQIEFADDTMTNAQGTRQ